MEPVNNNILYLILLFNLLFFMFRKEIYIIYHNILTGTCEAVFTSHQLNVIKTQQNLSAILDSIRCTCTGHCQKCGRQNQ